MNQVEDLLTPKARIIYCSPRAWSGINPRKHEPMPGQDQIINGDTLETLEKQHFQKMHTNKHLKQPNIIIEGFAENLADNDESSKKAFETLQAFLVGLRIFRNAIKHQRKGGILRKWFTLAYMWVTEMEKGYFTMSDLQVFTKWSKEHCRYYVGYWLKGELIIEYRNRKRKNAVSFFLLSSKAKALLSRGWVHSLGATYRKAPLVIPGDLVHTMRNECQMSLSQFAAVLKISVKQLYAIEIGRFMLTPAKSALLVDRFYYLLPVTYWPQAIMDEVKEGKRPRYGNAKHLEHGNGQLSHLEIIANAYTELKKIKKDL